MVGWFPFVAATLWSSACSFSGSLLAGSRAGCPACTPTLVCPAVSCPAVSCVCSSAPALEPATCAPCPVPLSSGTSCSVTPGTSWAALGAAFGAGAFAAAAFTWRLQLWLGGAWSTAGRFAVGDSRLAPGDPSPGTPSARRPTPLRPVAALALQGGQALGLPALAPASISSGASSASGAGDDGSVWRSKRS